MSFQMPISIRTAVNKVIDSEYVLPAIQREFVWDTGQIEKLFDSVMRAYPINSFLFWEVPPNQQSQFQFYRFLTNYHQRDARHNPPYQSGGTKLVTAVLDGQQRLTSLVVGLHGSYAAKLPNKRRSNPLAYPVEVLHLDLLNSADPTQDEQMMFAFRFMQPAIAAKT